MKCIEKSVLEGIICTDIINKPRLLKMKDIKNYLSTFGYTLEEYDNNNFYIYMD